MMRLAAAILVAIVAVFPLTALFAAPVTWLAGPALVVGCAGVIMLSVPLVTLGASLGLIAYALALVIVRPAVDPLAASAFGATLVVLLTLVHFAGRVHGAAIAPAVIAAQIRHWVIIVAGGVATALVLTATGVGLAPLLRGAALPVVVVVAALGALVTVIGVLALVAGHEDPSGPPGAGR